jgi:7-alpha-hydroxysteroid dehydrogenase
MAKDRIRVNAIAIGSVLSASVQDALEANEGLHTAMIEATPLGRVAEASEIAEVAQFLASNSSGFMTGQIVTVDGGRTLIDPLEKSVH